MSDAAPLTAIGLMSGTSMDGIDAAILRSDGADIVAPLDNLTIAYAPEFRAELQSVLGGKGPVDQVSETLTRRHADAVVAILAKSALAATDIDVIGFHGHTILHQPEQGRTWQIGDGALLASLTGIDVVADFRTADVAAGGEGAPFAPIFHATVAPAAGQARPVCLLNIGGVANLTWIGADASVAEPTVFDHLMAFDTGPGNALIDDWVAAHCGQPFDKDGAIAAGGTIDTACLDKLLAHDYFNRRPPKSLDRDDFSTAAVAGLSPADGAATLTAFTVAAIDRAREHLPAPPRRWIVTGGGRHNSFLMTALAAQLAAPVVSTEQVGLDGDAMEAQAFAYMAIRSLRGMPLSGPSTTGVPTPLSGGTLFRAS